MVARFGVCNSFKAEVMALAKELELAKDLDIKKLEVQKDNMACVQGIRSKDNGRGECSHLLAGCISLINIQDRTLEVSDIYREGNRAVE